MARTWAFQFRKLEKQGARCPIAPRCAGRGGPQLASWQSCRRHRTAAGSNRLTQIAAHAPPPRRAGARLSQEQPLTKYAAWPLSLCGNPPSCAGRSERRLASWQSPGRGELQLASGQSPGRGELQLASGQSHRRRRTAAGSDRLTQIVAHAPPPRRAGARLSQRRPATAVSRRRRALRLRRASPHRRLPVRGPGLRGRGRRPGGACPLAGAGRVLRSSRR